MKNEFEIVLFNALLPCLKEDSHEDAKMRITIACKDFEINRTETALAEYRGDVNELIIARFIAAKIAEGKSRRTLKYYKTEITRALQTIGKPYMEITADDIRLYIAMRIQRDKVSTVTANNERRNLSSFFGWLQTEEIMLRNPMAKVGPVKEQKQKKKAFEQIDMERIRGACASKREKAIIEMLASTWCRVSELVQIRIDEVDNGKAIVHGKGAKDREVFINARASYALKDYMEERKDNNPYLFPKCRYAGNLVILAKKTKKSKEWYRDPEMVDEELHMDMGTLEHICREIGKRAGVTNVHPHRFRRTGATMALRTGMPLTIVSKLLGHESIETTQIYLDISDDELQQAHEKYVM